VLKDFVVRARSMAGYDAPYVPGWDCHGLPIELRVDRELGPRRRDMNIGAFRLACRQYAEKFVDIMRDEFKRLGGIGDWAHPYLTMDNRYVATIVRALGTFAEQGCVYKGKKPVHWCIHCRTALAEAEVEYEDHASPSIYVEFPLSPSSAGDLAARVPELRGRPVSVLIWTTTPWTIPSNLAVAFQPTFMYGVYPTGDTNVIVAEDLLAQVQRVTGRTFGAPIARADGRAFEGIRFRHPLYDRDSVGVLADYVTLDQGTGAVHTAPGHGADDFTTGVRYGLEVYAPVGPGGHFDDTVGIFAGQRVFDANPHIEEALASRGRLWHRESFSHAYPHCWRCHNPVIFLATPQWFIAMDGNDLRARALDAVKRVSWVPSWGEERIASMVANRPDWCISRQRYWGVPIPAVDCLDCHEALLTQPLAERAADVFGRDGADAWYERPIDEFLPAGFACPTCGGHRFERERNILDVWFDSGSSHEAVLESWPDLRWPADLYLEGSDQYRGWFQSSLLVALGTRGAAPYRQVVTHGFFVDEQGRKMSKSLGNTIEPEEIIAKNGAETLRLWSAMVDFREEVRVGPEILARVVEGYRKLRNTCRMLVGNLYDFDPATDAVALAELAEIDRYALARYASAGQRIVAAYETYEFPTIFHALNTLATVDLSAFYIDVLKDRLYTLAPASRSRRAAQTALFTIVDGIARLMAPILPMTADELWRVLPGARDDSVHLARFPEGLDALADDDLVARWSALIRIREQVNVAIEAKRKDKVIGNSLAAKVTLEASGTAAQLLARYRDDLPAIFIVSQVALNDAPSAGSGPPTSDGEVSVKVDRADGQRCDRCWRYVPSVSKDPAHPGVCDRCEQALAEAGTPPRGGGAGKGAEAERA
jgi:isoleucyl-tRNA synthetase